MRLDLETMKMMNSFILLKMSLMKICYLWLMLAAVLSLTHATHHLDGASNVINSSSLSMDITYDSLMLGKIVKFVTFCFVNLFHTLVEHGSNVESQLPSLSNSKGNIKSLIQFQLPSPCQVS